MRYSFRISDKLLEVAQSDLRRPHPFAGERVGFLKFRCARSARGVLMVASGYMPVRNDGYIPDDSVGAMMNEGTILMAMQAAYSGHVGIAHVHLHGHPGRPRFSTIDLRESDRFVPSFSNVRTEYPHCAIVISDDSFVGLCWPERGCEPQPIDQFSIIGPRFKKVLL